MINYENHIHKHTEGGLWHTGDMVNFKATIACLSLFVLCRYVFFVSAHEHENRQNASELRPREYADVLSKTW